MEREPALSSFLPFYFRLRAFSIQRAQLSRSLEQAMFSVRPRAQTYFRSSPLSTREKRRPEIRLRSQASRNRDSSACKTSDISFSARFAGLLKAGVRLRASFMNELIH